MRDEDWQRRAARLADELKDAGDIADPVWHEVFSRVPRHVFVPHFARTESSEEGTRYELVSSRDAAQAEKWLDAVYSDTTLVTQVEGQPVEEFLVGGARYGAHTSSSTAPGLMAWMLHTLELREGHTVLEIGTGTGYNAALVSARLGSAHVTSVDIDEQLVSRARRGLAGVGYHPRLVSGDGRAGDRARAPFDRVISTCGLPYVPPAWIDQTRAGGRILTNVVGPIGGAMLLAQAHGEGRATGRFLPRWAGFMPSRHARPTAAEYAETYAPGSTRLDPAVLDDLAFGFVAQLHLPGARRYWATRDDGRRLFGLLAPDSSWAEIYEPDAEGRRYLEQGGPRPLWTTVESAYRLWREAGEPDWSAFTFQAERGQQTVSLGSVASWELPQSR